MHWLLLALGSSYPDRGYKMSRRYLAGFVQAGLFNPLVAPTPTYLYNLLSWGYNGFGQLGLGNTTYYSSPKQVGLLTTWSKITAGTYHTLATTQ